jgi:transmembrane sensor
MNAARSARTADPVEAASLWLVRHDSGLTDPERTEFAQWLAASPVNAAAWRDVSATSAAFAEARRAGTAAALVVILAARRRRARLRVIIGSASAATLAAAAAILLLFSPAKPLAPPPASPPKIVTQPNATRAATPLTPAVATSAMLIHPEERVLEDGSHITLNVGAEIAVDYTPATRAVRLLRGEAVFTVAKNPARPFVVTSGSLRVRAVGTEFAVQNDASAVEVLVTEGTVAVDGPASPAATVLAPAAPVLLSVGGRLNMDSAAPAGALPAVETVSADELSRRLAWREPRLYLSGTPLREAVALLNRCNAVQLKVDSAAGALRLSGNFRADNAEGFAHLLANNYGLQIERRSDGSITLRSTTGVGPR